MTVINFQPFRLISLLITVIFCSGPQAFANSGNKAAQLWIADESLISVQAPDNSTLDSELDMLTSRLAGLTESDRKNQLYWNAGAPNYRWLQVLLQRYAKGPPSPIKGRGLTLLNVAIYDAIAASENAKLSIKRPRPDGIDSSIAIPSTYSYPSSHAAAAAAAAGVLGYLLPEEKAVFNDMAKAAAQARMDTGVSYPSDAEAGMVLGSAIAQQVIAYADTDNSDSKFTGTRPTGPGKLKGELFVYPMAGQWKTMGVKSVDDFLPDPPPAFDSEQMQAELKELKAIKRTVPAGILAWSNHSTYRAFQWWYEQIGASMFETGLHTDPLKAAHAYATISAANSDAVIACFNAKYTWWQIRPSQLDESLESLFPSPPHPSYPSAHSCSGSSMATAITHFFPDRTDELNEAAHQGGYSRLIAGIHYPSDHTAGTKLGKSVAKSVLDYSDQLLLP